MYIVSIYKLGTHICIFLPSKQEWLIELHPESLSALTVSFYEFCTDLPHHEFRYLRSIKCKGFSLLPSVTGTLGKDYPFHDGGRPCLY